MHKRNIDTVEDTKMATAETDERTSRIEIAFDAAHARNLLRMRNLRCDLEFVYVFCVLPLAGI